MTIGFIFNHYLEIESGNSESPDPWAFPIDLYRKFEKNSVTSVYVLVSGKMKWKCTKNAYISKIDDLYKIVICDGIGFVLLNEFSFHFYLRKKFTSLKFHLICKYQRCSNFCLSHWDNHIYTIKSYYIRQWNEICLFVYFIPVSFSHFQMLCSGLWIKWILSVGRIVIFLSFYFLFWHCLFLIPQSLAKCRTIVVLIGKMGEFGPILIEWKTAFLCDNTRFEQKSEGKWKYGGYIILWWVGNNVPCNTWRFVRSQLTVIVLLPSYSLDAMFHNFI